MSEAKRAKRCQRTKPKMRQNDSVLGMMKKSLTQNKKSKRKPGLHSRSFAPAAITKYEKAMEDKGFVWDSDAEDDEFFDDYVGTSPLIPTAKKYKQKRQKQKQQQGQPEGQGRPQVRRAGDKPLIQKKNVQYVSSKPRSGPIKRSSVSPQSSSAPPRRAFVPTSRRRTKPKDEEDGEDDNDDDDGIMDDMLEFFDNADRKQTGLGLVAKLFGEGPQPQGKNWKPKRPYFTWWVTIIQIIVFIVTIATYGLAPIGVTTTEKTDEVLMTSLAKEQVSRIEKDNMWIGPREEDLIHVGAKYSPCMRTDENMQSLLSDYDKEIRQTACCVRNDGAGCFQSTQQQCPSSLSTWMNWTTTNPGYQSRASGAVCGQDPRYCNKPASTGAFIWEDDITQWPICEETANISTSDAAYRHMTCDVIGRPCCIGIKGKCQITTREYCDFQKGYFHEDKTLCSQVDCLDEVCGMFPFLHEKKPDQFYRLFTSLFLHAGLLSLLITVVFQMLILRDIEKYIGWYAMTVVYMGSGIAGSLGSAIFLPYHVEAGPSGSIFGGIAALFVEVFRWHTDEVDDSPVKAIIKMSVVLLILFLIGLLPSIDNWAHLFGFLFGLCISTSLRPYKSFMGKPLSTPTRVLISVISAVLAIAVFVILILLFYVEPVTECDGCSYFTCVPFTATFCDGMYIDLKEL